jgi:DNA-directed RNA polymerase sigma subunit (sigma70/sigma32)
MGELPDREARNMAIWEDRQAGMTFREIGRKYGLHPQSVRQIYMRICRQITSMLRRPTTRRD